jgi:hypothetical protein
MGRNKTLKVIIDTNLWVSFIILKKYNLLDNFLFSGKVRLLFSKELISEIQQTIVKPKLKAYFVDNALGKMLSAFEPFTDLIEVETRVKICRDSNDDFLLSLSKDGKADYLITGDNDLLDLKTFGKTKIVTIKDFIVIIK